MKRLLTTIASVVLMLAIGLFTVACGGEETPSVAPSTSPSTQTSVTPSGTPSVTPTTGTPSVTPTTGTPSVTPTTGTPSVTPTTGTPSVTPTTGTPSVTPTTGTPSVTPTTGAPSVTPTTGAPSVTPTTGTPSVTPTTGAPSVTPSTVPSGNNGPLTADQFYSALAFENLSGLKFTITVDEPEDLEYPEATTDVTYIVEMDGGKIKLTSPSIPDYTYIIDSTDESLYFYVVAHGEEDMVIRADFIGMVEDPMLAQIINSYLAVDYSAMILQYAAMFEDEGFDLESAVQEFMAMCEQANYDLKTIVHGLMEAYGLEEPDIEEMLEGVDVEELLLALGLEQAQAEMIVNHFETYGFNLDALLDFIVLNGFDLRTTLEQVDEFLASMEYSVVNIVTYALEGIGFNEITLGDWLAQMMGLPTTFTYETFLQMLDLESGLTNLNWVDALSVTTAFDYADYTYENGVYSAEVLLDEMTGLTISEALRFDGTQLTYYGISIDMGGVVYAFDVNFSDYNATEVVVPTEAVDVTLEDLLTALPSEPEGSVDLWSSKFDLDNYTTTIDITTNMLGASASTQYVYAETEENWYFSANNFAWTSGVVADFNAYGDKTGAYVNGEQDDYAAMIPASYTSIFEVVAFFEEDFVGVGENVYYAEALTGFSTVTGGGYEMVIEDVTVTVLDGYASSISYTALIDMDGTPVTETWTYTITNVNSTVIQTPSYAE